jgi:RNA polymerase sigma-70 factor (ECF subfamily)
MPVLPLSALNEEEPTAVAEIDEQWLAHFHAGDARILERCYLDHFASVATAARRILSSADAETVTHEVFYRLLSEPKFRLTFRGGNLRAWLVQVGANAALDDVRRRRREAPLDAATHEPGEADPARIEEEVESKILIEQFRRERLPPKWHSVFDARFLRQLSQQDAARELRIPRTSLMYQEQRIRKLLEEFLLGEEGSRKIARAACEISFTLIFWARSRRRMSGHCAVICPPATDAAG